MSISVVLSRGGGAEGEVGCCVVGGGRGREDEGESEGKSASEGDDGSGSEEDRCRCRRLAPPPPPPPLFHRGLLIEEKRGEGGSLRGDRGC